MAKDVMKGRFRIRTYFLAEKLYEARVTDTNFKPELIKAVLYAEEASEATANALALVGHMIQAKESAK